MTYDRRRRPLLVSLTLATALAGACFDPDEASGTDPRLLDRICDLGRCETEGSARQVSALTPDSTGFRLGPGEGKLTIEFEKTDAQDPSFPLELLVSGRGALNVAVPGGTTDPSSLGVGGDYDWVRLRGTLATPASPERPGDDARVKVVLSVQGDSEIDLVDVRSSELDDGGCSVAHVGRRRRAR